MPPVPADAVDRALAVRHLFRYIQNAKKPVVGLAPEGMDFPGGILGWPPPGSGRVIPADYQPGGLADFAPVGAYQEKGAFYLNFGALYRLEVVPGTLPLAGIVDKGIRCTVMPRRFSLSSYPNVCEVNLVNGLAVAQVWRDGS